jgi:replicative DNA helicase
MNRLVSAADIIRKAGDELLHPDLTGMVPSGFPILDENHLNGGFKRGHFIIIAARPSVGKTALADAIGLNAARSGKHVVVFSLEMSREEWLKRSACSIGSVDAGNHTKGRLTEDEEQRFSNALASIKALPLFIDDGTDLTTDTMRTALRVKQPRADLVIIDYLQLIRMKGDRYEAVSEVSRSIKLLAKELQIPFVVLCQLNRQAASDGNGKADKIPQVHHLKESGSLEQDADIVMLLYPGNVMSVEHRMVHLAVGKNRHGPIGRVDLKFESQFTRFTEMPWRAELNASEHAEGEAPVVEESITF